MTQMIRKHFLLSLPLDEQIKLVARKDHKSEAEVIRELLESGLQTKHQQTGSVGQALRQLAEIGKQAGATGPTDLSQNIDKYLYEEACDTTTLIVADTSGLMSLLVDTDANHHKALTLSAVFDENPGTVVISSHVFTELMNVLGKKLGHQVAVSAGRQIIQTAQYVIMESDEDLPDLVAGYSKGEPSSSDVPGANVREAQLDYRASTVSSK